MTKTRSRNITLVVVVATLLISAPAVGAIGQATPTQAQAPETPSQHGDVLANSPPNSSNNGSVQDLSSQAVTATPRAGIPAGITTEGTTTTVALELVNASDTLKDRVRNLNVTIESTYENLVQVSVERSQIGELHSYSWIETVRIPRTAKGSVVSEGVASINADTVHNKLNVTGEDTKVGVLSVQGFDMNNPEIAENTERTRSFANGIENGGYNTHGTGVAEIVVDTAPDTDLYLANFQTGIEYANAVEWMRNQNVDVIVMSVSFFQQPYDGSGFISEVADDAANDGIVWVNSAGNYAKSHWQGEYEDPDDDQWLNFDADDEGNDVARGEQLRAGSSVRVYLNWEEWGDAEKTDYDLHLVKQQADGSLQPIQQSHRTQGANTEPWELIRTTVPEDGVYTITVSAESEINTREIELLYVSGGQPQYNVPRGSVTAPAVGEDVISAGAYSYRYGQLEPFSSQGPTNDGRLGVDFLAPDGVTTSAYDGPFYGTSAAAPHAAGLAALVKSAAPEKSASDIRDIMQSTADARNGDGVNQATGYGWINATKAVDEAAPDVPPVGDLDANPKDPDGDGQYEDVNGDGTVSRADVDILFENLNGDTVTNHPTAFDYNQDGVVSIADVQTLFTAV